MKTPCTAELLTQGTILIISFLNLYELWEVGHLMLLSSVVVVKCSTWTISLNSVVFNSLEMEMVV